jgi:pimeloyl-ACP methyl ester carboxylesterase
VSTMTTSRALEEEIGFFDSAGQRVRYRVRGNGSPLLMIHGIGAPLELWGSFEAKLGDFQTITVDSPGSGRSSTPQGHFGMRQFAGVMDDLLTHLAIDSTHVLGLSLGGMIAQELARRSPERVEKLVLASTTPGIGGIPPNPRGMAVMATPARYYSRRHFNQVAPLVYGRKINQDPSLLRLQWDLLKEFRPSPRGYVVQLRAAATWSSRPWLRKLHMPVLAISGSDDRIVPVANSRLIASSVRDGRLEIIPGGGHLCLLRESDRTTQVIRDFLRDG